MTTKKLFFLFVLISIGVCSPVWTQRSHDLYHTSHVDVDDVSGPILCQPSISWIRYDVNPIDALITNAEIVVGNDNVVFYIRHKSFLRAHHVPDDTTLWEYSGATFTNPVLSPDGSLVYTISNASAIIAVDVTNGNLVHEWKGLNGSPIGFNTITVHPNGNLYTYNYVFLGKGTLRSFSPSLNLLWETDISTLYLPLSLLPNGNLVFVNNSDLIAIKPDNSVELWSTVIDGSDNFTPLRIMPDGSILLSSTSGTDVYNPDDGSLKTSFTGFTILAVVNDTLVAKGTAQIYLINDEGAIIWMRKIGSVTAASVHGSVVYISSTPNTIYGLDLETGKTLWTIQIADNSNYIGPVVPVGDGTILVLGDSTMYNLAACSTHGICSNNTCLCETNYFTNDCSVYCNQQQCKTSSHNNGECSSDGVCGCFEDYYPVNNCTVFCNNTECSVELSGHGQCSMEGECSCNMYYYEDDCSLYCKNGEYNNDTCHCNLNYFGKSCEVFCSNEDTCSGHGTCNNDGTCACEKDYEGESCKKSSEPFPWEIVGPVIGGVVVLGAIIAFLLYRRSRRASYEPIR